jgi:hypothetical protein
VRSVRGRFLLAIALSLASTGALAITPAAATATRITAVPGRDEIPFKASTDLSGAITGIPAATAAWFSIWRRIPIPMDHS